MSKINVIYSLKTQEFSFEYVDLAPNYCDISAGIAKHQSTIEFDGFAFGYMLLRDGKVVAAKTWPEPGVKYIQTDQDDMGGDRVFWAPDEKLTLTLWFENFGRRLEGSDTFTVPRPPKPYPSWSWNAEKLQWQAPVPYPEDGGFYVWDEEKQEWIEPSNELPTNPA